MRADYSAQAKRFVASERHSDGRARKCRSSPMERAVHFSRIVSIYLIPVRCLHSSFDLFFHSQEQVSETSFQQFKCVVVCLHSGANTRCHEERCTILVLFLEVLLFIVYFHFVDRSFVFDVEIIKLYIEVISDN